MKNIRRLMANQLRKLAVKIDKGGIEQIGKTIEDAQADDLVVMIFRGVDKNVLFDESLVVHASSDDGTSVVVSTFV